MPDSSPRLPFEIDDAIDPTLVTGRAGVPLVIELFRQMGVAATIDTQVLVKQRQRGLPPSQLVESLVALWTSGGDRCQDLTTLREDHALAQLLGYPLPAATTEIYRQKGYRTRLLAAAYRHHMHWSELIGGDLSMTIPYEWQVLFNSSDIEMKPRMQNPVPKQAYDVMYEKFADFRRAIEPDGMTVEEFDSYGPTVRTLRAFTISYHDLVNLIRDIMLPNPDMK
jgi:hypothetical protein